ncbi:MAG: hypothetical protein ACE366_02095 [Bradymonadia bacterium]
MRAHGWMMAVAALCLVPAVASADREAPARKAAVKKGKQKTQPIKKLVITPKGGKAIVVVGPEKKGLTEAEKTKVCGASGGKGVVTLGGKPQSPADAVNFTFRWNGGVSSGRLAGVKVINMARPDAEGTRRNGTTTVEGEANMVIHYAYHSISCEDLIRSKAAQWSWATRSQ